MRKGHGVLGTGFGRGWQKAEETRIHPANQTSGDTEGGRMNTLVLTVQTNGEAGCLYSELIDLSSIGSLEVSRASNSNSTIKSRSGGAGQTTPSPVQPFIPCCLLGLGDSTLQPLIISPLRKLHGREDQSHAKATQGNNQLWR